MKKILVNLMLLFIFLVMSASNYLVSDYKEMEPTRFQVIFADPTFDLVYALLITKTLVMFVLVPFVIMIFVNKFVNGWLTIKKIDYLDAVAVMLVTQIITQPII